MDGRIGKGGASRPRNRRAAAISTLEPLEGRRLMSAVPAHIGIKEAVDSATNTSTLAITGTKNTDVINVADNGTGTRGNVTVTLGSGLSYTSRSAVALIRVAGNGGNDQVTYNLDGNLVKPQGLIVNLGSGTGNFTANVNGNIMTPGGFYLNALAGAGNNTLVVNQSGATQSGSFVPYLSGGKGQDTLVYNGTGTIAAGASVSPEFLAGPGQTTIRSTYTGVVDGNYLYNLSVKGSSGTSNIFDTVNVAAGSTGNVGTSSAQPAVVEGGPGVANIHFAVNVDPNSTANVNAVVVAGNPKDVVTHTANVLVEGTSKSNTVIN